ncbi:MAG: hypothetical protein IPN96_20530 [Anaerolineales bacterium]|nr:hypothetical protein [Anaerolineales bacterium]
MNFTVTFSESVTGVDTSDFNLTTTGISGATVSGLSGTGSLYTVSVNTGSGDGTIRLNVLNDGSIKDTALNPLGSAFSSGEVYAISKPATFSDVPLTCWASGLHRTSVPRWHHRWMWYGHLLSRQHSHSAHRWRSSC